MWPRRESWSGPHSSPHPRSHPSSVLHPEKPCEHASQVPAPSTVPTSTLLARGVHTGSGSTLGWSGLEETPSQALVEEEPQPGNSGARAGAVLSHRTSEKLEKGWLQASYGIGHLECGFVT